MAGPMSAPVSAQVSAPVSVGACQGCGACLLTCPEHAFRPYGSSLLVLADRCTGCGECVEIGPVDAISFVEEGRGVQS